MRLVAVIFEGILYLDGWPTGWTPPRHLPGDLAAALAEATTQPGASAYFRLLVSGTQTTVARRLRFR